MHPTGMNWDDMATPSKELLKEKLKSEGFDLTKIQISEDVEEIRMPTEYVWDLLTGHCPRCSCES